MRSEAQREASRVNGAKSRGPKTQPGKNKTRFNGLKHGLRSNQVVLADEDPAEFQAELKGWADDWRPKTHTRAILVERAAVASWRLRRCVRAESDLLMELADRAHDKGRDHGGIDRDMAERADLAEETFFDDPAAALAELRALPAGVDRLIARWEKLDEVLVDDAEDWDEDRHGSLLELLGHLPDADPAGFGPLAADSRRLAHDNRLRYEDDEDPGLMPYSESAGVVSRIHKGIALERLALRDHRRKLAAQPVESTAEMKFVGVTPEIMLLHRYEMAHERSLRAAIRDLVALEKSGADLEGWDEGKTQLIPSQYVASHKSPGTDPAAASSPGKPGASKRAGSPAPSEPKTGAVSHPSGKARRTRKGRSRRAAKAGGGRSPS